MPTGSLTLRTVMEYFTSRGSTVFAAALDLSKAFDSVNHGKLIKSLVEVGVPGWIVNVTVNWYSKLYVAVRWNDALSQFFQVKSGVRQGSILSPALFNVFINVLVVRLRVSGFGCHINSVFLGCILYADDIILLSASVYGLQQMLNVSYRCMSDLKLTFNCNKSMCVKIGRSFKSSVDDMDIGDGTIGWCSSFKYLGIKFNTGPTLKIDTDVIKRKFYASCNTILSNSINQNELVRLQLVESYSLPILQYCIGAVKCLKTK